MPPYRPRPAAPRPGRRRTRRGRRGRRDGSSTWGGACGARGAGRPDAGGGGEDTPRRVTAAPVRRPLAGAWWAVLIPRMVERIRTRFLVVGSGVAGLHTAWRAAESGEVYVLTKASLF